MSDEQVTPASFEKVVEGAFQALQITDASVGNTEAMTYKERHEVELEKLAQEVADLPTVIDKRTRQLNQDQLTKLVRTRTRLDEHRVEVFRPITKLKKDWDSYIGTTAEAGLQSRVKALEKAVESNIEAFDKAEERRRQEELERQEAENTRRRKLLVAEGMTFDGDGFTFGPFRAEAKDVYAATPEKFEAVLVKVKQAVKAKKDQEEKERQEREAAAEAQRKEAARLKEEADRQAEERRKFEEERAEFNRQKEEREAKERGDQRFAERSTELRMMGAVALPDADGQLVFTLGQVSAPEETLRNADEVKWAAWVSEFEAAANAKMDSPVIESAPTPVEDIPFTEERFTEEPTTPYEGAQLTEEDVAAMDEAIRNPPTEVEPIPEVVVEEHPLPTAIGPVVGDQPIIAHGVVSMPEPAPDDESELELMRSVFGVAEQLQTAIAQCGWKLRNTNNKEFMHGIYTVHRDNTLSALAETIGVEVKTVHDLIPSE